MTFCVGFSGRGACDGAAAAVATVGRDNVGATVELGFTAGMGPVTLWVRLVTCLVGLMTGEGVGEEMLGLTMFEAMICVAITSGTGLTEFGNPVVIVDVVTAIGEEVKDFLRFSKSFLTVTFWVEDLVAAIETKGGFDAGMETTGGEKEEAAD